MRHSVYLAACAGALAVLCAHPGELMAAKTYRVLITSTPSGANVWIDDRSGEPAGQTPYRGRLSGGKHTVFLELDGYEFAVQEITVRRRRRGKQRFSFELEKLRYGWIDVLAADGSQAADGAKVLIDGEEVGTVPDTFEAAEGPHQIEVVKSGFKRFERWIEVAKGESLEVSVELEPTGPVVGAGMSSDPDEDEPAATVSQDAEPAAEGSPLLVMEAGLGAGWRRFGYENPLTGNLLPYDADSVALVDIGAEFWLGGLVPALRWFSLFGGASLSLPLTSVDNAGTEFSTTWFRREVGARATVGVGPAWLRVDIAEGGNAFTFQNAGAYADRIPEVEYEYLRMGASVGMALGDNVFGLGGDGLLILASAGVADRFADAAVSGMRAHGWFRRRLMANLDASVTSSLTYFSYDLEPSATHKATGSYDIMIDAIINAAYRF